MKKKFDSRQLLGKLESSIGFESTLEVYNLWKVFEKNEFRYSFLEKKNLKKDRRDLQLWEYSIFSIDI